MNLQIQEAQQFANCVNNNKFILRHIIMKLQNTKGKEIFKNNKHG